MVSISNYVPPEVVAHGGFAPPFSCIIKESKEHTMATRSRIGIELQDGSILSAYHHWDGYPVGWDDLETHYNSARQAAHLIDGGDMSSCWNDTIWGEESKW